MVLIQWTEPSKPKVRNVAGPQAKLAFRDSPVLLIF